MPAPFRRDLIEESLALMGDGVERLSRDFYDALFEAAPDLRALFADDIAAQAEKFAATLRAAVDAASDIEALRPHLAQLGARHAELGVTSAHYRPVSGALLDTLARAAGPGWRLEHAHAWSALLGVVAEAMISGAEMAEAASQG